MIQVGEKVFSFSKVMSAGGREVFSSEPRQVKALYVQEDTKSVLRAPLACQLPVSLGHLKGSRPSELPLKTALSRECVQPY
jgi:hypothetical protein